MMQFLWLCAGGKLFFAGTALILAGVLLPQPAGKKLRKTVLYWLIFIGAALIFLSATPVAWLIYIIWAAAVLAYVAVVASGITASRLKLILLRSLAASLTLIATLAEVPYHLTGRLPEGEFEKLYIIGDSVAAGLNSRFEYTWPEILRDNYHLDVIDLSETGATVNSALRQAQSVESENAIVLLEIGGNDLFTPTAVSKFEKDLKLLIEKVSGTGRIVVMLELPLQTRHIRYGMAQRRLAKDSGVILIPKSFLVSVFSAKGATIDLAHLTPAGHNLMADKIFSLFEGHLAESEIKSGENESPDE